MLQVTPDDLDRWRGELADYPAAQRAIDEIDACDGDVEDAAINLALHAGLEPDTSDRWLMGLAKRYRPCLCQGEVREHVRQADVATLVHYLSAESRCPEVLVLPVAILVSNEGIDEFCRSFDERLSTNDDLMER
jgi:hypothetical protein